MKQTLIDVLFGILIFIVIILCEMLVTHPFGAPDNIDIAYKQNVNLELRLASDICGDQALDVIEIIHWPSDALVICGS